MHLYLRLFICSFIFLTTAQLQAQTLCEFQALPDTTVCGTAPIKMHANVDSVNSSTAYRLDVLPFAIDSSCLLAGSGTDCGLHTDDIHSGVIPIGFTFCYFGSAYNECLISANGYITFDLTGAGAYSPWPIGAPIPSAANPVNSIMYPWQDLLPDAISSITYQTVGAAPFRKFIVRYNDIPYFSCTSITFDGMVVLYESTNIIETYIFEKPVCVGWNGGYSIHGIQDATGTIAYVVPGRNYPSVWTDSNSLVRFTPIGTPTLSFPLIWTDGVDTIASGPDALVVPTDTTTYFAYLNVSPECGSGTAFVLVDSCVVNVIPDPFGVTAGPDTAVCVGDSVQLFVNGTDPISQISWIPNSYIYSDTSLSPYVAPLGSTSYVVFAQNAAACVASDTVEVTINVGSVAHTISPDTVICAGMSTLISVGGGTGVEWTPTSGLADPTASSTLANPDTSTTYYAIIAAASGCPDLDSITVDVSDGPDAYFAGDIVLCAGSGTTLSPFTASGTAVVSYEWSTGHTSSSIFTDTAGLYWVEVMDAAGCVDRDSIEIMILSTSVSAGNDTSVCSGELAVVTAEYIPGASYLWTGAGTIFTPFSQSTVVFSGSTQTYTVTISIAVGSGTTCSATDDVTVVVNPNPVVVHSNDTILCEGDSVLLFAAGGMYYDWSPLTDLSDPAGNTTLAFPTSTTSYIITVTDSFGCAGSGTVVVAVNPNPTIDLGADTALCCGGSTTLEAALGFASYAWSNGDSTFVTIADQSGPYSLVVTDFTGCTATDTRLVGINCINPIINATPSTTISNGASTELSVTESYSGSFSYDWSPAAGLSSDISNPTTATPTNDAVYQVCVTDINSICTECDTIEITVIDSAFITVPNAFSPNGDGLNDFFEPLKDAAIQIKGFQIFNRWGDLIFNNESSGWDGRYKGVDQNVGAYVWIITYSSPDPLNPLVQKEYVIQGTVSLIR